MKRGKSGKMPRRQPRNSKGQFTKPDKWMKHVVYYQSHGWTDLEKDDADFFARLNLEAFAVSSFTEQAVQTYKKLQLDLDSLLTLIRSIYGQNVVFKAIRMSTWTSDSQMMISRFANRIGQDAYIVSRNKAKIYVKSVEENASLFQEPIPRIYGVPNSDMDTRVYVYFKEIPMQQQGGPRSVPALTISTKTMEEIFKKAEEEAYVRAQRSLRHQGYDY